MYYSEEDYMYNMKKFLNLNFNKGYLITTLFKSEDEYYSYKIDNIKKGNWMVFAGYFNNEYEFDENAIILKHSSFTLDTNNFDATFGTLPGANYITISEHFNGKIKDKNYIYKEWYDFDIFIRYFLLRSEDKKIGFAYNLNHHHGILVSDIRDKKTKEIVALKISF